MGNACPDKTAYHFADLGKMMTHRADQHAAYLAAYPCFSLPFFAFLYLTEEHGHQGFSLDSVDSSLHYRFLDKMVVNRES